MAEEMGLKVDKAGFNQAMEEARERARSARGKVDALSPHKSTFTFALRQCIL